MLAKCRFCQANDCLGLVCSYCNFLMVVHDEPRLTYHVDSKHKRWADHQFSLEELLRLGFKRVSNRYRCIARVDVADEEMLQILNYYGRQKWKLEEAKDHFRRVHSMDCLEAVPESMFRKIPLCR